MNQHIRKLLQTTGQYIVEIKRENVASDILTGIIIDYSKDLMLLAQVSLFSFTFDGYSLIRNKDITNYRIITDPDEFLFKAQLKLKLIPEYPFKLKIDSWKQAMENFNVLFPLLLVEKDRIESHFYAGKIVSFSQKTFLLFEIHPDLKWDKEYRFYFDKISRIDFGDQYSKALWEVLKNEYPEKSVNKLNARGEKTKCKRSGLRIRGSGRN